jgi:TRAP-type mannitol/chloroaromatic compound transport system substrate-binding protein
MTEEVKKSRRKFLTTGAAAIAGGAAAASFPNISVGQSPTVLKVQAAWGGGIFLEFAQDYVRRVNEMSGGSLKIDLLGVGAVVKTAEMQTAVHKGVLDGAHLVTAYWYSKSPVASLFGTGPCFGWSANELMGWIQYGGGRALYNELMDSLRLDLVGFFSGPMPAQPLGWFKEHIKGSDQMKGGNGYVGSTVAWRRNPAGDEERPDRCGRVQQPDLGQGFRHAGRVQALPPGQLPPVAGVFRNHLQ